MTRIVVGLTMLVTAEICIRLTCGVLTPLPAKLPSRPLDEIPKKVAVWTAVDLPLDKDLFDHTGAAAMLDRCYSNTVGDVVAANFDIWIASEDQLPHSPELCYHSAGWQLTQQKIIPIPLSAGDHRTRLLSFEKMGMAAHVLYCYQVGDETVLDFNELRTVRQSMRGSRKYMPAIVKMMLQSSNPDSRTAERQLVELASQLLPSLAEYK